MKTTNRIQFLEGEYGGAERWDDDRRRSRADYHKFARLFCKAVTMCPTQT